MRTRKVIVDGPEWTEEAIEQEIQELQELQTKPTGRKRKTRGPKTSIDELMAKQKIRANLDLTPYLNSELTKITEKLGLQRQALVIRYILEGIERDKSNFDVLTNDLDLELDKVARELEQAFKGKSTSGNGLGMDAVKKILEKYMKTSTRRYGT